MKEFVYQLDPVYAATKLIANLFPFSPTSRVDLHKECLPLRVIAAAAVFIS